MSEQKNIIPNDGSLTPEQYRLVKSPSFKAWFGDWENALRNVGKSIKNAAVGFSNGVRGTADQVASGAQRAVNNTGNLVKNTAMNASNAARSTFQPHATGDMVDNQNNPYASKSNPNSGSNQRIMGMANPNMGPQNNVRSNNAQMNNQPSYPNDNGDGSGSYRRGGGVHRRGR